MLALLLLGCAYDVPADPDAPAVLNVLSGTVLVNSPDEVADTVEVGSTRAGRGQRGGRRRAEPSKDEVAIGGLGVAIRRRETGRGGALPFGRGRQASANPAGVRARGKPRNADDGGGGRRARAEIEVAGPIAEITGIGEERAGVRAAPSGVGLHEREKFAVGDGAGVWGMWGMQAPSQQPCSRAMRASTVCDLCYAARYSEKGLDDGPARRTS